VGHHIATTSSPLFASAPNFLAGLGCAGCLRQPRQGATAFFMRAARRKEHHCSQVTSLFFSIFRDMYGVFYLNVCLFFVVNGFWYGFGSPGLFFGKQK
jgi:hypothetical protein